MRDYRRSELRKLELQNRPAFFYSDLYLQLMGILGNGINNKTQALIEDFFTSTDNVFQIKWNEEGKITLIRPWEYYLPTCKNLLFYNEEEKKRVLPKTKKVLALLDAGMFIFRYYDTDFRLISAVQLEKSGKMSGWFGDLEGESK